ncbi:SDR family oxidoreductase [Litoreibacter roseus]|uniref:Short-chain dehydrogenase n=1 Tax=Litoreibacter roseus TaxID=2601869 RepID=A0A6N6JHM2_9RHOB|nr:SDR family oxidoreductase [Litoreibacter roseus]GFE65340.1 short-chain dehydrogenase [Litoreibacter roseus]
MQNLDGKSVVITGASRGIGEATARHMAELGAKVVLAARSGDDIERIAEDITQAGGTAMAKTCDVSDYAQVEGLASHTTATFGRLDVLINNAGLIDPIARLDESDPAAWSTIVDVNLKGVYYGYRAALPIMLAQGEGTIINISSGAATGALEGWSHYCATKAGVLSLTKCGHKEYGDKGLRIMGLSPGTVATEMQVQIKASGVNPVSQLDPDVHIPPEWVAKGLAFLCGSGGDAYLGADFSLKTDEGRKLVGLPLIDN